MNPKNLSYFIDLKNFPINELESSKYQKIIVLSKNKNTNLNTIYCYQDALAELGENREDVVIRNLAIVEGT